jgi:hypothetical protein
MDKYISPVMFAGLHNKAQSTIRYKTCFDTGELDIISRAICNKCEVDYDDFVGRPKSAGLSDARKIFYYLCRIKLYTFTCRKLGEYTGGRDHSTITVAVQRCGELLEVDPDFKELFVQCWIASTQQLKLNGYSYKDGHKTINYGTRDKRIPSLTSSNCRERSSYAATTVGELNC